jgi:hypothetical protein
VAKAAKKMPSQTRGRAAGTSKNELGSTFSSILAAFFDLTTRHFLKLATAGTLTTTETDTTTQTTTNNKQQQPGKWEAQQTINQSTNDPISGDCLPDCSPITCTMLLLGLRRLK